MNKFLDEYIYVKKVIGSCANDKQRETAKKWAEDWSKRMKYNYPEEVPSWTNLYLNVMEK
jgi:hypothetical protein